MTTTLAKRKSGYAIGRHLIVDFKLCDYDLLSNKAAIELAMLNAANNAGATIVDQCFRHFSPHGVSGFIIISESHFSIHTWPEYSYAAVDIFTCGDSINFDAAVSFLKKEFGSQSVEIVADLRRGEGGLSSPLAFDVTSPMTSSDIELPNAVSWERLYNASNAWGIGIEVELIGAKVLSNGCFSTFLNSFAKSMNLEAKSNPECGSNPTIELAMCSQRFVGAHVSIYGKQNSKSHYLEVLATQFIDPQIISRIAIDISGAEGYRLRASLRR